MREESRKRHWLNYKDHTPMRKKKKKKKQKKKKKKQKKKEKKKKEKEEEKRKRRRRRDSDVQTCNYCMAFSRINTFFCRRRFS